MVSVLPPTHTNAQPPASSAARGCPWPSRTSDESGALAFSLTFRDLDQFLRSSLMRNSDAPSKLVNEILANLLSYF